MPKVNQRSAATVALLGKWKQTAQEISKAAQFIGIRIVLRFDSTCVLALCSDQDLAPSAIPWLWVPPTQCSAVAASRALCAGALAVFPQTEAGWLQSALEFASSVIAPAPPPPTPAGLIAASESTKIALAQLHRAAQTSMAVLLTGETGTGKDLFANQLHRWSKRSSAPFIAINCAAIPDELIEGELFGYVRGAFSGAVQNYDGQFRAAAGGTMFLDEVHDTPKTLQTKLLRVLEDRVVSRLGENSWRPIDFRIVAASNRELPELVAAGKFGADLFQRLAILQIHLPPLRERQQDIPHLAMHFVEKFYGDEKEASLRVDSIDHLALDALQSYSWPGNIRELRNTIYSILVNKTRGQRILVSDLPTTLLAAVANPAAAKPVVKSSGAISDDVRSRIMHGAFNLARAIDDLERTALEVAGAQTNFSPTKMARLLGDVGRGQARDPSGTVRAMLRRHGMTPKR